MNETINRKDLIVMKLLHYFITKRNYSPIILQGAEDEIWLENLDSDYKKSQNENEGKKEEFSPTTTLNLIIYTKILEYYKYSPELIKSLRVIISLNNERNKVAHGLSEIDSKLVNSKKLQQTIDTLRFILQDTFEIDDSYFSCYQILNNEMLDLLRQ